MSSSFKPGDTLAGRFQLEEEAGEPGRSGYAFLAKDIVTGERLVCKVPRAEGTYPEFLKQYCQLRDVYSPGVVKAVGYFEDTREEPAIPILVMEHVEGQTLEEWARDKDFRERLDSFRRIAEALAEMHDAELCHGDLTGTNIIVKGLRVVLIDPESEGSGSIEADGFQATRENDYNNYRALLRSVLDTGQFEHLNPLIRLINSETPDSFSMWQVAAHLESQLGTVLPGETAGHPDAAAKWSTEDRRDRVKTYQEIRNTRSLQIETLYQRVRSASEGFDCETRWEPNEETMSYAVDLEKKTDSAKRGTFQRRTFTSISQDDNLWRVRFDDSDNFRKPWPYEDSKQTIARGRSEVNFEGTTCLEHIELSIVGGKPIFSAVRLGKRFRMDESWISRNLRVLLGLWTPGVVKPMNIEGEKTPLNKWPTDLRLEKGDIHFQNGDFAMATGVDWLRQSIGMTLGLRPGEWFLDRKTGSRFHELIDAPISQRNTIARRVVEEEISKPFSQYIDEIHRFDVLELDRTNRRIELEIELKPHESELCTWQYTLKFPTD